MIEVLFTLHKIYWGSGCSLIFFFDPLGYSVNCMPVTRVHSALYTDHQNALYIRNPTDQYTSDCILITWGASFILYWSPGSSMHYILITRILYLILIIGVFFTLFTNHWGTLHCIMITGLLWVFTQITDRFSTFYTDHWSPLYTLVYDTESTLYNYHWGAV